MHRIRSACALVGIDRRLPRPALAGAASQDEVAITIYSSAQPGAIPPELYRPIPGQGVPNAMAVPGYALVRDDRDHAARERAARTIKFTDVAALIDPTTVTFTSLTDPAHARARAELPVRSREHDKLLLKYIDRPITVEQARSAIRRRTVSGTLLSAIDGHRAQGQRRLASTRCRATRRCAFPELPGGLNTQAHAGVGHPLAARRHAEHARHLPDRRHHLVGRLQPHLQRGRGREQRRCSICRPGSASSTSPAPPIRMRKLKLIAGDVHRVAARAGSAMYAASRRWKLAAAHGRAGGFEEKAFFEFHLYTLGRPTTLPNNSTKQIELFDQAKQIPAKKMLVYYGAAAAVRLPEPVHRPRSRRRRSNKKVDVYLEFKNDKQFGLGVPLPAGPHPRLAARRGGRQPRVHRRGHDRPHAEGRDRCA